MRSKRGIAGRGVGRTYILPEHGETHANDFGGESDALRPGITVCWAKNSKSTHP